MDKTYILTHVATVQKPYGEPHLEQQEYTIWASDDETAKEHAQKAWQTIKAVRGSDCRVLGFAEVRKIDWKPE